MEITVNFDRDGDPANAFSITAESFSWGVTYSGSAGMPQGPASPSDFTFTAVGSSDWTVVLKSDCESGNPFKLVTVSIVDPSGQHPLGLEWLLSDAFISAFQTGGGASETFPVDSVSISANTISVVS